MMGKDFANPWGKKTKKGENDWNNMKIKEEKLLKLNLDDKKIMIKQELQVH